jgi:hypothetical protein
MTFKIITSDERAETEKRECDALRATIEELREQLAGSPMADVADAWDAGYEAANKDSVALYERLEKAERARESAESRLKIEADNALGWKCRAQYLEAELQRAGHLGIRH